MDSENGKLEERLKSLLFQLSSESGILERIIYKGKNQHRGSLYFQALLKVRRDLRLLQSAGLGQILNSLFPIIRGKKPAENALHSKLDKNKKKHLGGSHSHQNRLLGVARLLSQMIEPILKAAIQISLLLAKTFFMGFSLTILACLARLRVLVQQMLIDVVSVFNMVSACSQKHSLKLSSQGIEACVEYYSTIGNILTLECIWEADKYVLREITQKIPEEQEAFSANAPIEYRTLELLGKDSFIEQENMKLEEEKLPVLKACTDSLLNQSAAIDRNLKSIDSRMSSVTEPPRETNSDEDLSKNLMNLRNERKSRKPVAFVAVQISKPSETEWKRPEKKMRLDLPCNRNDDNDDDAFLDFSFSGTKKMSLF